MYPVEHPHSLDIDQITAELEVRPGHGLDPRIAAERRRLYGPNTIEGIEKSTFLKKFADQFRNLMIVILLVAAFVAGVMGEILDTIVILIIVILNALLGSIQEYRAERALEALRKMTSPDVSVRRGGHRVRIDTEQLVPGDIVYLEAGNIVPGDLRLIESVDFEVDEAALTGESLAVAKCTDVVEEQDALAGDRFNMAFKGTNVTRGHALGITVATGRQTELGRIASLIEGSERMLTPLQARLQHFARRLALAVSLIAAVVFVSGLLRGEDVVLMLLTAISLAVAAIPEALPAVISISLAIGANRMSSHNALMRRLSAVETLGSVTYICADKTGTLTLNEMRLATVEAGGTSADSLSEFEHSGELQRLLGLTMALCNNVTLDERQQPHGDPTEVALFLGALEAGFEKSSLETRYPRLAELPFHADRRVMSSLNRVDDGVMVFCKGAPESLLPLCSERLGPAGAETVDSDSLLRRSDALASDGYRVLALACRRFAQAPANLSPEVIESGLVLLGLVGLIDPPREEIHESIVDCNSAGITPVMITGDHPGTARAIARRLGIGTDYGVLTGNELERLPLEEFARRVRDIRVYARVTPEQKIKIVSALQQCGEYVAMTGDGVNDAPALQQANIGVAMGLKGTDIARESSDMVLRDDNFATIVRAVREGRRIFDNIRKFIKYTMTSNSGEIWVIFLAPFIGLPLPLLPIQILWINLVTDGLPGLALSAEPHEQDIMQRPPRKPDESIFAHGMWQHIVWVGLLIGALSLFAQAWAYHGGSQNWRTVVFTTLTFCQLAHVLVIRSEKESLLSTRLFSNPALLATIAFTIGLQLLVVYVPLLNGIFHTSPLSPTELAMCLLLPMIVFLAVEGEKWLFRTGRIYRSRLESGSGDDRSNP